MTFIGYFLEFICLGRNIFKGGEVKAYAINTVGWGRGGT